MTRASVAVASRLTRRPSSRAAVGSIPAATSVAAESAEMRFGRDHNRHIPVADAVREERSNGLEQFRVLAVELNGMPYVGGGRHVNQT
jgi:hypothetical protein